MSVTGRFVPTHFHDPLGLALRLLRGRDPDALGAMRHAALGMLLSPLDLLLAQRERARYAAAPEPRLPQLFVCGPPRSGTTLVAQTLIAHLPVAYFSNLTAVFPRSPLTATAMFEKRLRPWRPAFRSYYGRTAPLLGPNDGLQLWDRWLGSDRTRRRESLTPEEGDALRRFFGAHEALTARPVVTKNNNLNLQAAAVAAALPTARFLCLTRDPVFLGQALLLARREIHGNDAIPYGLYPPEEPTPDPVTGVARQVRWHTQLAGEQQATLGSDRFQMLSYEAFCEDPARVIYRVADEMLGIPAADVRQVSPGLRFSPSASVRLPAERFAALKTALAASAHSGTADPGA